jgi:hypothetical protein
VGLTAAVVCKGAIDGGNGSGVVHGWKLLPAVSAG